MPYSLMVYFGLLLTIIHSLVVSDIFFSTWFTIFNSFGWTWYLIVYSKFSNRQREKLFTHNDKLPDLELIDLKGELIHSSSFTRRKAILIFYRGNWCPFCMTQIEEITNKYGELEKRNVRIIFISPQPEKYTRKLANKFGPQFQFLYDKENSAAKQLGILDADGLPLGLQVFGFENDTVKPTVIILDEEGSIIYSDLTDNYRIRPEPSEYIMVIDKFDSL